MMLVWIDVDVVVVQNTCQLSSFDLMWPNEIAQCFGIRFRIYCSMANTGSFLMRLLWTLIKRQKSDRLEERERPMKRGRKVLCVRGPRTKDEIMKRNSEWDQIENGIECIRIGTAFIFIRKLDGETHKFWIQIRDTEIPSEIISSSFNFKKLPIKHQHCNL